MAFRRRQTRAGERVLRLCAVLALPVAAVLAAAVLRLSRPDPAEVEQALPDCVVRDLLPVNEWSRPGDSLKRVRGIVLHYVGNPGTSAQANRNYFASLEDGELGVYASSHFIVGLEGEVVQCVPLTEMDLVLQRTSFRYFGKFLQEGTPGERMGTLWLRQFQNVKNR